MLMMLALFGLWVIPATADADDAVLVRLVGVSSVCSSAVDTKWQRMSMMLA